MNAEFLIPAIVFFGLYYMMKLVSDHLLKRKLIKAEQYDRPGILDDPKKSDEVDRYPSLKWGLVALMTGLGFVVIDLLKLFDREWISGSDAVLPIGILLIFVSLGFLIYFFIINGKKK